MEIDNIIEQYISHISEKYKIEGVLICGSYTTGLYNKDSDIDTLFLVQNHEFDMKLEVFKEILFDRILVDYNILINILNSISIISDILSYSLGSSQKIIVNSDKILEIIKLSKRNILDKNLKYIKPKNKQPKIVDNISYKILNDVSNYHLIKSGNIII